MIESEDIEFRQKGGIRLNKVSIVDLRECTHELLDIVNLAVRAPQVLLSEVEGHSFGRGRDVELVQQSGEEDDHVQRNLVVGREAEVETLFDTADHVVVPC